MGAMLDWLWRLYDAAYRRLHGLQDLPTGRGSVLQIGVARYRGRRLSLRDGTVVRAGDLVGTLHFHNKAVAATGIHATGSYFVQFTRALAGGAITMKAGDRVPVAFAVWNGAAGDRDGKKSVTIWQELLLER